MDSIELLAMTALIARRRERKRKAVDQVVALLKEGKSVRVSEKFFKELEAYGAVARFGDQISIAYDLVDEQALESNVNKLRGLRRSLPGKLRNKPCDCGSGLKAKACNCDIYDRK